MWPTAAQIAAVERRDQTPQLGGIETPINLDPKTLGQYDPKLSIPHPVCRPSTILNYLYRNNLLVGLRLRNTPSPCIERMHSQTARRTELLASQPTPLKLRNQAVRLCPAPPARQSTNSVRIHPSTSAQREPRRKNGIARRDTLRRPLAANRKRCVGQEKHEAG
jgi:hypothetical protein